MEHRKEKGYGERRVNTVLKAIRATCEILGYQGKWDYRLPVPTHRALVYEYTTLCNSVRHCTTLYSVSYRVSQSK